MPQSKKNLFTRILIWRAKHISQQQFIYILSILVGFTSGVGAVVLKNLTHFIQLLLEGKLIQEYHHAFYFVYPLIGLTLTFLIMKYIIRNRVNCLLVKPSSKNEVISVMRSLVNDSKQYEGISIERNYTDKGEFLVTLVVTDSTGLSDETVTTVLVVEDYHDEQSGNVEGNDIFADAFYTKGYNIVPEIKINKKMKCEQIFSIKTLI